MGYADRFYYGQCKLSIISNSEVTVTNGTRTWTVSGTDTIMIPGTSKYTITGNGKTEEIYAGYGDHITKEI